MCTEDTHLQRRNNLTVIGGTPAVTALHRRRTVYWTKATDGPGSTTGEGQGAIIFTPSNQTELASYFNEKFSTGLTTGNLI